MATASFNNPVCFFDVALGGMSPPDTLYMAAGSSGNHLGEHLGRIKMELYPKIVPKTAENFRQFCTGETKGRGGRPQGYKGAKFHRVVRQLVLHTIRVPRELLSLILNATAR